jgi:hypothetical protein
MVLAVVDLHGAGVDVGLERRELIGQRRQGMRHERSLRLRWFVDAVSIATPRGQRNAPIAAPFDDGEIPASARTGGVTVLPGATP